MAIVVLFAAGWLLSRDADAAPTKLAAMAPTIVVPEEVVAVRNVAVSGDLFLLYRHNLPAGFDESDVPLDWQEFGISGLLSRVIFQAPPSLQDRVPVNLGHGLMGHYLEPGHGAPWGSEDVFVRLQGNPSLFVDTGAQDRGLDYSTVADSSTLLIDSESRQQSLCDAFVDLLENVQQADPDLETGDLVNAGNVTSSGTDMAVSAFSGAASVLPKCFAVGISAAGNPFDPPAGAGQSELEADAEASDSWQRWQALADEHNFDAALVASTGIAGMALLMLVVLTWLTGLSFGVLSSIVTLLAGALWVPHWLFQIVLVVISILDVIAGAYWWSRAPR